MPQNQSRLLKLPLILAVVWALTITLSMFGVAAVLIATLPWHEVRVYIQQLALWQTWVSIIACVGLLALSRQRHEETEAPWAKGSILIYVLAGLVTAILLNYGMLPAWQVHAASLWRSMQVLIVALIHWSCAWVVVLKLLRAEVSP